MATEKRLIDANALKAHMCRQCNIECGDEPCEPDDCFIYNVIMDAPTVDAVEVVRCKDCTYGVYAGLGKFMCDLHEFVGKGDFYCASGERKDNG